MTARNKFAIGYYFFATTLILIILKNGLLPQAIFPMDSFVIVNGGWKMANGQIPYTDFFTIYGPAHYVWLAVIMLWTQCSPEALPLSFVIPLISITIITWNILIARYSPLVSFTLSSYLIMIWGSSMPLHFLFFETGYAMFENREGYVLACLIFILLIPCKNVTRTFNTYFLTGMLLGIIIFIKLNYFTGTCIGGFFIVTRDLLSRKALAVIPGFILGALPFSIGLRGFLIFNMLEDFQKITSLRTFNLYEDAVIIAIIEMVAAAVFLHEIIKRLPETSLQLNFIREKSKSFAFKGDTFKSLQEMFLSLQDTLLLEIMIVVLVSGFLEFGSYPKAHLYECPLIACYTIILLSRLPQIKSGWFNLTTSIMFLIGFSYINLFLGILFPIFSSTIYPSSLVETLNSKSYPLSIVTLRDDQASYFDWPKFINEGIALMDRHPEMKNKRIVTLGLSDYFSYALLNPPPIHLPVWMSFGVDLSDSVYPPSDYLFSDADAIMIPLKPEKDLDIFGRIKAYQTYIKLHYRKIDQSDQWMLWEQRAR